MKMLRILGLLGAAALLVGTSSQSSHANLSQLTGNYYILPSGHPDTWKGIDGSIVTGLVANQLGPNGRPVATIFAKTRVGGSGAITSFDAVTSEILWWTAGPAGVQFEKTQDDTVPFNILNNFFVDGYTSNPPFRAVHWQGTFIAPENGIANFSLAADDDAWLFVNGNLLIDNGGVKALKQSPSTVGATGLIAGNSYTVDLFFADRHVIQSAIKFSSDVQLYPIPEPAFFQMGALAAFGGLGLLRMRRQA